MHMEHQWNDRPELCLKVRSVPRSKHPQSRSKQSINQSILYRVTIALFSVTQKKHVNTECGQDIHLLLAKRCGIE